MALAEALEHRGAYIVLPVGHGKTLITYLLPTVFETSRSVTIVPGAGLREKTYAEFGELGRDWQGPRTPSRVLTWQELSTERGEMLLEELKPTLIVIDESDELANFEAAAPARIDRYIEAHPTVVVMCLTGTPIRKSIMNFWHLLYWCLRKGSPMPLVKSEAVMWAASIDHQKGARGLFGISPGPLGVSQDDARAWFKARLAETPGVIIVDGDSCTAPLEVHVRLAREDAVLDDVFAYFLKTAETPDGQPVTDPLSRWRIDGQLGCGLWLRWNPSPPDEWRDALRVFGRVASARH
jgi:hypothetical protein